MRIGALGTDFASGPSGTDFASGPSGTDAGILLERYTRLGNRFLDGVRGDFAVRLIDPARALAIAARDGLGNRFLAYHLGAGAFLTSTDEVALARAAGTERALDVDRLVEFFVLEELSGPRTFFHGVTALLPGELLRVSASRVERERLQVPDLEFRLELARFEDYVELFAERLDTAVARALRGADRAAVLLSGGLDSTPIAALAARRLAGSGALGAFSWKVDSPAADDRAYVEAAVAALGIGHQWVDGNGAEPFSDLARWPVHPSTPEQTAFRWLHQRSYEAAADLGFRRLLTGFGGDALYGNARRWAWDLLAEEGAGPAIDRLREVAAEIGWPRTLRSHLIGPLLPRRRGLRRSFPDWLTSAARERLRSRPRWPIDVASARRPRQAERLLALLDAHGANVERHYLSPFGLEQRTPLRDPDLVALALAVPDHVLQQGTESRVVLRAAIRGLVPEPIRRRTSKASFRSLIDRGLAPENLRWARAPLRSPDALWRGIVVEDAIERWLVGEFRDEWDKIGLLNAVYAELWRLGGIGVSPASLVGDQ